MSPDAKALAAAQVKVQLTHAIAVTSRLGFRVCPLGFMSKGDAASGRPPKGWPTLATKDPAQVEQWFGNGEAKNMFVATGEGSRVLVVDVDGPQGRETLAGLLSVHPEDAHAFSGTLRASTGREDGGTHYYFRWPAGKDITIGSNAFGSTTRPTGIDWRGNGGYALLPPSTHPSGAVYQWLDPEDGEVNEIRDPPSWLVAEIEKGGGFQQRKSSVPALVPSTQDPFKSALEAAAIPTADTRTVITKGRNTALSEWAGGEVRRFVRADLTWAQFCAAVENRNQSVNSPPLTANEVATTVLASAKGWWDSAVQEYEAEQAKTSAVIGEVEREVLELNKTNALVGMGGRVVVASLLGDGQWSYTGPNEWALKHANPKFRIKLDPQAKGNGKLVSVGKIWLDHLQRRSYDSVGFYPDEDGTHESVFNLFRGWPCVATEGDLHHRWLEHVHENICNADDRLFGYVIDLCAHLVQRPWDLWGVALVMHGEEGTGKGVFAHALRRMFGVHGATVTSQDGLLGRFNASLMDKVLVFADEAFYARSRKDLGSLNALITEPVMQYERKNQMPTQERNFCHLVMASNNQQVVTAHADARRYVVTEVSSAHRQDHKYFQQIEHDLYANDQQGLSHLRWHLAALDITGFHPARDKVTTGALSTQRQLSLDPLEEWWLERCVQPGMLPEGRTVGDGAFERSVIKYVDWDDAGASTKGTPTVSRAVMYEAFTEWARARGVGGIELRSLSKRMGLMLKRVMPDGHPKTYGAQRSKWVLPALEVGRAAWVSMHGAESVE